MSGRKSKKNQRLGSSRRGPKGLNTNIEKDENDGFQHITESEDGQDEFRTTSETQFDHPPSSSIEQQTSELECPSHAMGHKDSLMETGLPERKRKMGSTRKSTGRFKGDKNLDDVRTAEELDEQYRTQPNTSTTEKRHVSLTEQEQSSFPSDVSLQNKSSGFGKESGTTPMFAVSENKEITSLHHENVGVQEHSRNMTENERKAEVMGEAKMKMSEVMAQTWDDVARDDPSSHTESALLFTQSLLANRAELKELAVVAGTETINQSVAFPLVDSEKPLPETSSHHETPLLNEALDFEFASHSEDLDILNKVLEEAGSHFSQYVCDARKDTNPSYDFTEAKKGVPMQKEKSQLENFALHDQESSLIQHDIATLDNSHDCSMVQTIVGGSRSFDMPVYNISHAEPTTPNLPHDMRNAVKERQEIHIEMKQENDVGNVPLVTCDILTDLVSVTEEDKDPDILAMRENENMSDERGSETEYAFKITDQCDVRDHNVTQIILDVRDNEKGVETSTETTWVSHQNSCDVSTEKEELYKGQEHYSLNISLTHSPTQDGAGEMLENEEVRKERKETENTAVNDVTSNSDSGSYTHQLLQFPDKEGYDLHEMQGDKGEKEGIFLSVESENAAFERTHRNKMGAALVPTLDVEDADLHLQIEAQNTTLDSTNSKTNGTEENTSGTSVFVRENTITKNTVESNMTESDFPRSSPDAYMEALKVSENSERKVSIKTNLNQSDINIVPQDSHREETPSKSGPVVHKRKMGSTRRPLKGNKGQRKETEHQETLDSEDLINVQNEAFRLESKNSPDESTLPSLKDGHFEEPGSSLLQSSGILGLVSEESTAISICHITESQTLTNIHVESQENAERVAAEEDKETEAQNKTSDSTTSEAEETEKNKHDAPGLVREVEVIGDTDTVVSNMTHEFLQSSPDANMEALKVSEHSEENVSGETDTILNQSDINIVSADSHREETQSKSSSVIQKRKMGSTCRPLKGNTGQRNGHYIKEIFSLEDEPSPEESRYTAVSISDISESQNLTKRRAGSHEHIGDVEIVPAEGDTESQAEDKTFDSTAFEEEAEVREVLVIRDAVKVVSNMITESDLHQTSDANMEMLKVSENPEDISDTHRNPQSEIQQEIKMTELSSEAERTEDIICEASVSVKEDEFTVDTVTPDSNMTTNSDIIQSDTLNDAKLEALILSENTESVSAVTDSVLLGQDDVTERSRETDRLPEQSHISVNPDDSRGAGTHSVSSLTVHKRKMGSTGRPLKGKKGQRKETEHDDENETLDSKDMISAENQTISLENESGPGESTLQSIKDGAKEQEMEICEKNDVEPVEESETALLQSSSTLDLMSEESTAISICNITESQTLTNIQEVSQENTGDAEREAAEEDKNLQLEIEARNTTSDLTTSEAEEREKNRLDATVSVREEEVIGDTDTVVSNITNEFLQSSPDAHTKALKVSENAEKELSGETDTILKQSDISIIPADSRREETQSKSSPVIQKRKMGSTRRPLKGKKGQRKETERQDENETLDSEDMISAISICHITESQTLTNINVEPRENTGDAERVAAVEDKNLQLEIEARNTSPDAYMEALNVSEHSEKEVSGETDTVAEQSYISIIPSDSHREETHSESSPVIQKRKIGSTRRPLKGNKGQRKETEHDNESETLESKDMISAEKQTISLENESGPGESTLQSIKDGAKEQEMEICKKNDVEPVEESESALLQSLCISNLMSEESTEINICNITESQTLTNTDVKPQENTGDAKRVAAEEDKDLKLEIEVQNKTSDLTTSEAEETEKNRHDAPGLVREVEVIGDTDTVVSNMTHEFLQSSSDAHMEALKVSEHSEKVSGETDTVTEQSDISMIPADSHREETHSESSPVIQKRKMGSTRRPSKGKKGQRKETEHHDENETLDSEDMISAISISHITESQTLTNINVEPRENTGGAERVAAEDDKNLQLEIEAGNKTSDSTTSEAEETERNRHDAHGLVKEVEVIGDKDTVVSNMTTESDFLQSSSDAHMEALKVSEHSEENISGETDTVTEQSDISMIPADSHREETHSESSKVIQKRKMGSTRRPLKKKNGQRKETEHHDESKTLNIEDVISAEKQTIGLENKSGPGESTLQSLNDEAKEQEMEICEKNYVEPVEESESALLQSSCISNLMSEETIAISICNITESQTLTNIQEVSQENTGDAERVAAEEDKVLQLEIELQNKTSDLTTSEAEETEKNKHDAPGLVREVEVIGDTDTVVSNMTTESNFLQSSPDAHMEALKVSEHSEENISGETDTVTEQSDISIIPADAHREETHSESSPVIQKRKMGSTRRPLKGNTEQRNGHDIKEIFSLEDEPSPEESRYTAVSISDISESQTLTKSRAGSHEHIGDVEIVPAEGDTESQTEDKTFDSTAFEEEAEVREVLVIGDAVKVVSNMITESDLHQTSDANMEMLKVSENPEDISDTHRNPQSEIQQEIKMTELSSEAERKEDIICEASVSVREDEFTVDTVTPDSNMTTNSDIIQNDTLNDAKLEALILSENTESVSAVMDSVLLGQDDVTERSRETDTLPEQSHISVDPDDSRGAGTHSVSSLTVHKRKMGSTRRTVKGMKGQRKETEHDDENETLDCKDMISAEKQTIGLENESGPGESTLHSIKDGTKEQEMEICKKNYVEPVEESESALLQSQSILDLVSEESTAISFCNITESQTLTNIQEVSQENTGDAERVAADKNLQLEIEARNTTSDLTTSEAEEREKNRLDATVSVREEEVIGDTDTVVSNITNEFLQSSPDAHTEALKVSENAEKELSGETDTILKQSDISIIPADSHREETQSKSSPVIQKRKMGSTRRPLKGNKGQRKETEHDDESETLDSKDMISAEKQTISLEYESGPGESTLQSIKDEAKEQEMEICAKNYVEPVEESESALLQSLCISNLMSEESTAINICHITESQTLTNTDVKPQENTGDAKRVAAEEDKDLKLEIEVQNKTSDLTTSEAEETAKKRHDAPGLIREVEVIGDTDTVESNMTHEFLQSSSDAHMEAFKMSEHSEKVSGETVTVTEQSDISIIPADSHREKTHSESSPVIQKRKMGSTRRPLKGKKGQRKETEHHDENETLDSEDMISAISICPITESQTLTNTDVNPQENTGDAERVAAEEDKVLQLEIEVQNKTSDLTTSEAEETEKNRHDAPGLVREVKLIGDTDTLESNITHESDLLQNDNLNDRKLEALILSENTESVSAVTDSVLLGQDDVTERSRETDRLPEQSHISVDPDDSRGAETHSVSSLTVHKRKMGSTRRPLKGKKGQRKETEHDDESEILDSKDMISAEKQTISLENESGPGESTLQSINDEAKEQEMEICKKNDVEPVEESETALLQSLCISNLMSEESTAINICHITESQTLTNIQEVSQENTGDAERMAAEEDLQLQIDAQNKTSDSTTSEAEETEKNIHDAPVSVKEEEVIGDTDTVVSNMTTESDFLQSSPDAHTEALKVSEHSGETDTVAEQSDISIIPADSHREETHSESSPVIQKRKMGSTRRPLKGKTGQRNGHDIKEIFNLKDEPSPEESRYTAVSISDISESQTLTKRHAGSHEHIGDVEIVPAEGDTESQAEDKTFDSTAFDEEAEVREVLVIGDAVKVVSNMITESDLHQTSDANVETLKVSEKAEKEFLRETDTILKQRDISTIPTDRHREETQSKSSPVIQKRKMGSTRRPLKGNKGQRKETEHHDENEILDSEEMNNAISICPITESQTLTNIYPVTQESIRDAERGAEDDKNLQLETEAQNKKSDSTTSEAEETEKNRHDAPVSVREVEVIVDTDTLESNMTHELEFLQSSPDAHMKALKVSEHSEENVFGETDTIHKQREEKHSKSSPVIQKRKMGSTRRPLKGDPGQRKGHDEKEIFNLEDEPSPEESRYTTLNICDISESQTLRNIHAGSHENIGDVVKVSEERDTESQSEDKTFDSTAFEEAATEENICAATALDRKAEFVGDPVEINMTTESDLIESYISSDSKPEAFISEITRDKITEKTDTISKPEDPNGDEEHTKLSLNVHKRKMGSTRRPLRGNKEQRKVREESKKNNEDSEEEEDPEKPSVIPNRDNLVDHNVTQEILNISDVKDKERKTMKMVDMSVQKQFDDLELDQRLDAYQTQTGLSQDDTDSHLLEFPESTADSNSLSDVHVSDALLTEETRNYVSSNDVLPTEVVEGKPVSKMSVQKRKMGSTRKRGKRMVNDKEVEDGNAVVNENTITDDETSKSEEKLTPEEAITGSPVHQQLFSSSDDKEGHDIQDIICKSDVQAENSEQNDPNSTTTLQKPLIESQCSSNAAAEMVSDLPLGDVNTYLDPKESVIPKESHREDQPNLNPVVQKRKMGSTRKTLRGNKGQGRIGESKKINENSEGMTQEPNAEPHLETRAKTELDEEVEENFQVEFSHPVASLNMFLEPVKEFPQYYPYEVSEEKGIDITGNESNNLSEAINEGTKDKFVLTVSHKDIYETVSEPEHTEITHKVIATQEKRRKMGSTRRNPRAMHGRNMADNEDVLGLAEDRETEKADNDLKEASSFTQSEEVSSVSTTDPESEMLIGATDLKGENDPLHSSRPTEPETPENTLQICDKQLVNADVTKNPQSETVSTEKRRKMGSTRKNAREGGIRGKREGYEYTETKDTNLQMLQDSETSLVREDVRKPTTYDYSNQSEDSLLSEIERALNTTSQSPLSCDWELITKEPDTPDLGKPENSEIRPLQAIPSTHSEPNSPGGRRRKMGSTRKNPRQQLKAERQDEDKECGEIDENSKANQQEKKDLERVEVSVVHNITENKLNKDYLDVSSAHTSSNQLEETTNPVSQEKTSPSTKRKFGSRRATKDRQGFGRMADSDIGNESENQYQKPDGSEVKDKLHSDDLAVCDPCLSLQPENRPASEQRNIEARNEKATPKGTGAGLVSLDQIIKHDRSTGARQTVNLKNRNTEVVQFNVVMVGNSCVGKTSFIRRFHEGQYTEDYHSTIGVDTCVQTVALPDKTVKLQIWDTAGQERFHSITTQVFHKADGLLLMYEITCSKSFISVRDWISQARERAPDDVIMMLLGNKSDSEKREVQIQEGADLAREYNIHFMECSAATGANVSESMMSLAEMLVQRKPQKEKHTTLRRDPPQKKSGCC